MNKIEKQQLESAYNPFKADLQIPARNLSIQRKVVETKDIQDGIIVRQPDTLTTSVIVEDMPYTRVYNPAGYRLHINSLSPNAKSVYLWFVYELESNYEWLYLNKRRYKLECGGTWNDLQSGLIELSHAGIINPSIVKDVYWINPRFFFNGNRLNKYPDCIVER